MRGGNGKCHCRGEMGERMCVKEGERERRCDDHHSSHNGCVIMTLFSLFLGNGGGDGAPCPLFLYVCACQVGRRWCDTLSSIVDRVVVIVGMCDMGGEGLWISLLPLPSLPSALQMRRPTLPHPREIPLSHPTYKGCGEKGEGDLFV